MSIIALIFKNVSVTKWWGKCQYDEISMTCLVSHIMEEKIAGCINGWLSPGKCRRHSVWQTCGSDLNHILFTNFSTFYKQYKEHLQVPCQCSKTEKKKKKRRSHACPQAGSVGWQAVCVVSQLLSATRWVGAERMVFSLSCCCLHRVTRSSSLIKLPFSLPFARSTCISPISSRGDSVLHLLASTSKDAPL